MAVTPLNPEIKIIQFMVNAQEENGNRKLAIRYRWWDQGVPTTYYVEYDAALNATPEDTVNLLIGAANDNYDAAHEV